MITFQDIASAAPAPATAATIAEMMAADALELLNNEGRVDQAGLRRMGWRQSDIDTHGADAIAIVGRIVAALGRAAA